MKTYWRAVTLAVEQVAVFPLVSSREFFYFTNVLLWWHFTAKIKSMFTRQDFLFSYLLLCDKPSPNLVAPNNICFAHRSAIGTDLRGELSSLMHLAYAGAAPITEPPSLPGTGLMVVTDVCPFIGAVGWNSHPWPPQMAWASSQHAHRVPRAGCQEGGSQKLYNLDDAGSEIT